MIRLSVSALALCAGLSPAFAMTAPEAADLLEDCFGAPCEVTVGSREDSDEGDVRFSDVNFTLPGDEVVTLLAGDITLTETEDGVVAFPGDEMRIIGADGEETVITHKDLTGVITKAVGSDVIAIVATTVNLTGSAEGTESSVKLAEPVITVTNDEDIGTAVEVTVEEISIEGTTSGEEGGSGKVVLTNAQFSSEASAELIESIGEGEPAAGAEGTFSASFAKATGRIESPTGPIDLAFGPVSTRGDISDGVLAYEFSAEGVSSAAEIPDLGPLNLSMDRMNMTLTMPVDEEGGAFSSTYEIAGLGMDEQTWAILDGQGKLSHEPGSLSVKIAGTLAQGTEGELTASDMSIEKLDVSVLGARAEAEGQASFDPTSGAPSAGNALVTLTGFNRLINSLGEAGLLPPDLGMQARAMLGVFAVPVAGQDDVLTSEISMGEDGALMVNGAQMQ